jgi:RHS repeat-associated protein
MGEKFSANPVTGTGSLSVPIYASPGRSGFGPQLSLSYDSGAGDGPFGFGWSLSLPAITRKTDKGLPKYQDAEESDVFILSGAEDLVPVLINVGDDQWEHPDPDERTVGDAKYRIERYRPRIEGLFARIERWMNEKGETHWRSISKDNVTTLYGKTKESRIFDPEDPTRVFSWLICESYDDKGNAVVYEYVHEDENEDPAGVDLSQAHERNRTNKSRSANRYLKRIKYGNRAPRQPGEDLKGRTDWLFEVVFDYGEHDPDIPTPNDNGKWLCRHDPFSSYRAGFEVRTYRLCQRALMFHHFPEEEEVGKDYLVRSTDFVYRNIRDNEEDLKKGHPIASFVASVTQSGYKRKDGRYLKRSLPPLEFEYSQATVQEEIREVDPESLENLPYGLDGANYQWVDLDGEGLSSILSEQDGGWFYKRNLSPITTQNDGGEQTTAARFAPVEQVAQQPSLTSADQQFLDLAGDGQVDLVLFDRPLSGYYERTQNGNWSPFVPFESVPSLAWDDPNLKFVDLTGDGHADILVSEEEVFAWYPSLAEAGFGPVERVRQALDEEKGPRLVFADGTQSLHLADISGDGLTDLVRIRNGEVCYWPNLGYGRFGAKVTMDDAPCFDAPDLFDQRRVHLADIDGSGVTDIIYLARDGVQLYFNQSGNSWSEARTLTQFPHIDNLSAVTAVDLLGNGTACLVWSSPLPGNARQPMRYVDLMGGQKPHLLVKMLNNLGAETHVHYAPSTRFYLADKMSGRPWITRLPFPVHVVERVETHDRISRNRFVIRYAYHHGYFDGPEREFRGFGMVEQRDTEEFAALSGSSLFPDALNIDEASHVPPVLTKTWFHTGAHLDGSRISRQFENEYYRESHLSEGAPRLSGAQLRTMLLDDTVLPDTVLHADGARAPYDLTDEEEREACRALRGSILRQEVYALDGMDEEEHPYSVSERNYTVELLQPREANRHAVFFAHPRETVDFHCERDPADPRLTHNLTLEVDAFGNVLRSTAVGYGRRRKNPALSTQDQDKQTQTLITCAEHRFTNPVDLDDYHRTPLLCESRTYELTGLDPNASERFDFATVDRAVTNATSLRYEETPSGGLNKRLIEHTRTLYRQDDLSGLLPLSELEPLALPGENYALTFTPGLVAQIYGSRVTGAMLANEGRYVHSEGDSNWWVTSGRVFYSPNSGDTSAQELAFAQQHFFLPHRFEDPFGATSSMRYDLYDLLLLESKDPLHNTVTSGERDANGAVTNKNDYRVLQPAFVTDPNGNRSAVAFDALGLVVGTAVMAKVGQNAGDSLIDFNADLQDATVLAHIQNPLAQPHVILHDATARLVYDLFAYYRTRGDAQPQPAVAYTLTRETHAADLAPGAQTRVQHSFLYSDGFAREVQTKIQAEPGPLSERGPNVAPRWVGSGWTIFNNKGRPVRQFEPFFSATHAFEFAKMVGVSPARFYDPVQRVVATLHPNHTYEKVVFDPWQQTTWDVNDTVLQTNPKNDPDVGDFFRRLPDGEYLPTWYAQRQGGAIGAQEQVAANKAAAHANTPTIAHFDALGRPFLTVTHNRFERDGANIDERYETRVHLDIEGNQREVVDARDRVVVRYDYDMLGNRIHQASMEAGERRMLNDVAGKPVYAWDSRGHTLRTAYDALRRPAEVFLRESTRAELLVARTVYGETQPNPEASNLRGKAYRIFDDAGIITTGEYDFKGNLLRSERQLLVNYKNQVNWNQSPALEKEVFTNSTRFDALNRAVQQISPHSNRPGTKYNVIHPTYNEANLLERLDVWLLQSGKPPALLDSETASLHAVANVDYNARGQRTLIEYGNGVRARYEYDQKTFRLTRLLTTRGPTFPNDCPNPSQPPCGVQNLSYTYDPAGNIIHIRDDAQQTVYFRNRRVEPSAEYTYDAIYRLAKATGREHLGQTADGKLRPPTQTSSTDTPRVGLNHPGDGKAMGPYTEAYEYDEVGNIARVAHKAVSGAWTRTYAYSEPSLLEPGTAPKKTNNRLSATTIRDAMARYTYDAHGNTLSMPHLPLMRWDHQDQLRATAQQVVRNGVPETTYHVYDAHGQRVRKVTEQSVTAQQAAAGKKPTRMKERLYLGGFEAYREYAGDGTTVTLERETLHIMDDTRRIAVAETRTQGSDGSPAQLARFQFENHLGSASLELDAQAQVISYEEYYPYGSTSYQATRSQTESPKRYRYIGKERDEESGLYYLGARYCAPWLGRWLNCDPAGMVDGTNSYAYVSNNPIRFTDRSGTQQEDWLKHHLSLSKEEQMKATVRDQLKARISKEGSPMQRFLVASGQATVEPAPQGPLNEFYTPQQQALDEAPAILGLLPGFQAGWTLGELVHGSTISGHTVNRWTHAAKFGVELALDAADVFTGGEAKAVRQAATQTAKRTMAETATQTIKHGVVETSQVLAKKSEGVLIETVEKSAARLPRSGDRVLPALSSVPVGTAQFSELAGKVFQSRFAATPELGRLWQQVAAGLPNTPKGFAKAREAFWTVVNKGDTADARAIQSLLREAGYELQGGSKAPLNRLLPNAPKSDRLLTIDHIDPKSQNPLLTLDPENLVFLPSRDNAQKGVKIITFGVTY